MPGLGVLRIGVRMQYETTRNHPIHVVECFYFDTCSKMPPKKNTASKKQREKWKDSYAIDLGLRVMSRSERTGFVNAAICRFCETFGREHDTTPQPLEAVGQKRKRGRGKSKKTQHFDKFRVDNIKKHHGEAHPKKWNEYLDFLQNNKVSNPRVLEEYFTQPTIKAFYQNRVAENGNKKYFSLSRPMVEVAIKEILFRDDDFEDEDGDDSNASDDDETTKNRKKRLPGDIAMDVFIPEYEEKTSGVRTLAGYHVELRRQTEFDYVVRLLASGLQSNQISTVFDANRDILGTAGKHKSLSPGEVATLSRVVCAIALQLLSDLLCGVWAFSIAADASTDQLGNSHLDIRLRLTTFEIGGDMLSFHLLAIPLFNESHSGRSLFNHVIKLLAALCPDWTARCIRSSTDGAPNMTGCESGFSSHKQRQYPFREDTYKK